MIPEITNPLPLILLMGLMLLAMGVAYVAALVLLAKRESILPAKTPVEATWGAGTAGLVFVMFALSMAVSVAAYRFALPYFPGGGGRVYGLVFAGVVIYLLNTATLFAIFRVARTSGRGHESLGFWRDSKFVAFARGVWVFLLWWPIQVLYALAAQALWGRVTGKDFPGRELQKALFSSDPAAFAAFALIAVMLAPFFEEIIFRALIQRGLEKKLGAAGAIAVTAALFTAAHGGTALQVAPVAVILGLLYHRTRDIRVCMGFHCALNSMSMLLLAALKAGMT